MEPLADLADRLRDAMKSAKVRHIDLAKACAVSPAAVTKWLNGDTKKLSAESLAAAARALGIREEWLRTGKLPRDREARDSQADRLLVAFQNLRGPLAELLQAIDAAAPADEKRKRVQ